MNLHRKSAKNMPLIFKKLLKITRKIIKIIEFLLLHTDFKGLVGKISYQLIPLHKLHMYLDKKAAKNIPLYFTKLFKI